MNVVIISVTKVGDNHVCVGAMQEDNGRPLRLMYPHGRFPSTDIGYRVGDIWNIDFVPRIDIIEPHNEDVVVRRAINTNQSVRSVRDFLMGHNIEIWTLVRQLFEGQLDWTSNGSGYLNDKDRVPTTSVGFFTCVRDLVYRDGYYEVERDENYTKYRRFSYVGVVPARIRIPAGTLIRVSLARWWAPPDQNIEERCYCQVSGWYL
jgi:hypothetical protein